MNDWEPTVVSIVWYEDDLIGIDCHCGEYIVISTECDSDCPRCGRVYRASISIEILVKDGEKE
jgi:hypothetical protein